MNCWIKGCTHRAASQIQGDFCKRHKYRWMKYGEPTRDDARESDLCCIVRCDQALWSLDLCVNHYLWYSNRRKTVPWMVDDGGYQRAHNRVRAARGYADSHACVDCGGKAEDWSLRHDAAMKTEGIVGGRIAAWSESVDDYAPRCRLCHARYDSGK